MNVLNVRRTILKNLPDDRYVGQRRPACILEQHELVNRFQSNRVNARVNGPCR